MRAPKWLVLLAVVTSLHSRAEESARPPSEQELLDATRSAARQFQSSPRRDAAGDAALVQQFQKTLGRVNATLKSGTAEQRQALAKSIEHVQAQTAIPVRRAQLQLLHRR